MKDAEWCLDLSSLSLIKDSNDILALDSTNIASLQSLWREITVDYPAFPGYDYSQQGIL
eukprot:CAMPEP_0202703140 /NCGR_PEP_ID=MMETSP1385-20130828/16022_1 /ASSEMBLY_ACC=CAM_ASM_000861 /TAXON_ID=933848 /ORGANISM="Elphidium margaritaceum" /LENGTH=58 /DNA_ID=CAMNT_0049360933 /DNA_START=16 /DNA_END=189 /DNA_ORIENTATION=+